MMETQGTEAPNLGQRVCLADLQKIANSAKNLETVALVLEVQEEVGYLLVPEMLTRPDLIVFFDLDTTIDGATIRSIKLDCSLIIQPGLLVYVLMETGPTAGGLVRCTGMIKYDEESRLAKQSQTKYQQTPLEDADKEEYVIVHGVQGPFATASTVDSRDPDVLLHTHALSHDRITEHLSNQRASSSSSASPDLKSISMPRLEESELIVRGRVLKVRMAHSLPWTQTTRRCQKIALTIRSHGDTFQALGVITEHLAEGGTLKPMDPTDLNDVGINDLIYFPKAALPTKGDGRDFKEAWPIGSKLIYEACAELPGRQFKWRAIRLIDAEYPAVPQKKRKVGRSVRDFILEEQLATDEELDLLVYVFPIAMSFLGVPSLENM